MNHYSSNSDNYLIKLDVMMRLLSAHTFKNDTKLKKYTITTQWAWIHKVV
jgi:hypothetical protein